jgi:hypothetical protein
MKLVAIMIGFSLILSTILLPMMLPLASAAKSGQSNNFQDAESTDNTVKAAEEMTLQLLRLNKQYKHASEEDKPELLQQMQLLADQRQLALTSIVTESSSRDEDDYAGAAGVLKLVLSKELRKELPKGLQAHLERQVTLEGQLTVVHTDDFTSGTSRHQFFLSQPGDDSRLEVHFVDNNQMPHSSVAVSANGELIGNSHLVVSPDPGSLEVISSASSTAGGATVTGTIANRHYKVAVILYNFRDNKVEPFTKDFARDVAFTGTRSVNAYYQEISFGKMDLQGHLRADGDIFGWYSVPYDSATSCPSYEGSIAASQMAQADGFNGNNYDKIVYAFPWSTGCPQGAAGWAVIGGNEAWIHGYFDLRVVTHELGHTFGLYHASSLSCTATNGSPVSISSSCARDEYGDPFDAMGSAFNGVHHMSTYHKGKLNFYETVNKLDVPSAGTYYLTPIEEGSTTGVQALRIPWGYDSITGKFMYYYVEYRKSLGFDDFPADSPVVNGISLRLAPSYPESTQTLLIDGTPGTVSDFGDSALKAGSTFIDPFAGITVKTLAVAADKAEISVQFGATSCLHSQPGIMISPTSQWGNAGSILTYKLYVTNQDSAECSASTFSITPSLPSSTWSQTQTPAKITLSPGASGMVQFSVTSPQNSVEGFYTLREVVTNIDNPAYSATATASYNVDPRDVTPPTITAPAGVTISVSSSQPTLTNLCQNLAVSGISANGNDGNIPANVNDDNLSTRWSNQGKGSWITLDLGQKQAVCNMDIAWYKGNERSSYFVVSASTDGINFKAIYSGMSGGTSAQPERHEFADTVARYLKVTVNGNTLNNWASISEIDASGYAKLGFPAVSDNVDTSPLVSNNAPLNGFPIGTSTIIWTAVDSAGNSAFATQDMTIKQTSNPQPFSIAAPSAVTIKASGTSGTTNICQNLQVSGATAKGNDGNVPANVLDNNLSTRWSNSGTGSWIILDLGSSKVVCNVDIAWYKGNERSSNFIVAVSTDGVAFKNVFTGKSSGTTVQPERYEFSDSVARFIKITVNGNNLNTWASITEIDAYGYTALGIPATSGTSDTSPLIINNLPANGLAIGTTTIQWSATDSAGKTATALQEVKVVSS